MNFHFNFFTDYIVLSLDMYPCHFYETEGIITLSTFSFISC